MTERKIFFDGYAMLRGSGEAGRADGGLGGEDDGFVYEGDAVADEGEAEGGFDAVL